MSLLLSGQGAKPYTIKGGGWEQITSHDTGLRREKGGRMHIRPDSR